jgi:transposase
MPPAYVKPYVKRGKTDAAEAEAICEAVRRPTMRFVPVKSAEQQAALVLDRTRDLLVKQRTQLVNMIGGLLAEFGSRWRVDCTMPQSGIADCSRRSAKRA